MHVYSAHLNDDTEGNKIKLLVFPHQKVYVLT